MGLHIIAVENLSRRAVVIFMSHDNANDIQMSLESVTDMTRYIPGKKVTTKLGSYKVPSGGLMVMDFTPALSMPVYYRVTADNETARSDTLTVDHDQYVWVKSKKYSDGPIGLLLKDPPKFSFDAEVHSFYGLADRTQGLGYGMAGVRHPGSVEMSFYTWTFEEAARVRNLIRDNPLCVQWPGMTDEALMIAPWYLLQDVSRTALGPPEAQIFEWTWVMSPVHSTKGIFKEVSATYSMVEDRGWPSYEAMAADSIASTYERARAVAVAFGGPPAPEGSGEVRRAIRYA